MPDITMCDNEKCPINKDCHRYTAHASELWQSFASFEYDRGCPFFINNKDYRKDKKWKS